MARSIKVDTEGDKLFCGHCEKELTDFEDAMDHFEECSHFDHTVTIYPEACCERCGEVIHNHFDCPDCGTGRAATSAYHEMTVGEKFTCQECGSRYKVKDLDYREAKIELIQPNSE